MAENQTLNFGPEWLRALSGGGSNSNSIASPPLSPAMPKYKLADYRYGREEMLALYVKDNKIPIDLQDKEFLPILQEDPLPPLALVPFTEEEQRNFSMSVNSAAVLRLTGRGGGTVAGAPRGRSTSRGRGRGRGDGGFYQRSFDEVEGGFGRGGREMHRSQSWEERGDRRFEKPGRKEPEVTPAHYQLNHIRANYEEAGGPVPVRKHDLTRSESENWRTTRDELNDGPRLAAWREHPERRRFPFDGRGEEERGYRHPRSGSGSLEDDRDALPEWCLEDAEEETGIFDSSGAFHSLKKGPKEPILEEVELDFRPMEECEEPSERDERELEESEDAVPEAKKETEGKEVVDMGKGDEEVVMPASIPAASTPPEPTAPSPLSPIQAVLQAEDSLRLPERSPEMPPESLKGPQHMSAPIGLVEAITLPHVTSVSTDLPVPTATLPQPVLPPPLEIPAAVPTSLPFPSAVMAPVDRSVILPHDTDEDEGLKHFEQEAEKMVAYLQDGVADDELAKITEHPKLTALPITHEAALKWFYKDPQGEIQGPFSNQEMAEWFQAGYFTMTLLVKRGCDEAFQPLGEIMKLWGRVPFTPGPAPPPILGDVDQERIKRNFTAINLYQMQQLQYQYLLRQQFVQAQALAQQKAAALTPAPPPQPQPQPQQQINMLLHQALKMRSSEALLPPVTRSMSVPDSGSVWDMQNPPSQAPCTPNMQPAVPNTAWESSSVWDLPVDAMAPAPTIEQIQQLEKAKAMKMELERREAELRAKREEEERKRLEEALRAQQEEEQRKRLEEEELARRKQEEALRRQRELEEAQRRQKEEEERLAQEEALRRLEERRREEEEEERRKREEFLRKQEEERRKQEELEALRKREEEKRREEEEAAAVAAAAAAAALLARQQQEEQQELLRQQEALRQRQQQQQQDALRRLQQQQQQQQLAHMKLPSSSKWGQQSTALTPQSQNALSLAEIQKLEEEKERLARQEQRRQQQELQKVQQQSQQVQSKLPGWGNVAKQPAATKSLLEIQREEAQQMKQRKDQKQQQPQQQQQQPPQQQQQQQQSPPQPPPVQQNRTNALSSSAWGSVTSGVSTWGSDTSSIWGDTQNSNVGFWDDAIKETAQPPPPRKSNSQKNKGNANLSTSASAKANKKVEEEEKLLKLFQGASKSQDGFMQWCEQTLHTFNSANNLDVPTFASFLKEVDSPYEVHDYVRAYLGDSPQAKDFAKQFLERRAKQNANQQKPQQIQQQKRQQQQDSVWRETSQQQVHQSNHSSLQQQQRFETVTSGKKKKKQKMVKADPSLLGFSVNAASERLNMGEIETVEDF